MSVAFAFQINLLSVVLLHFHPCQNTTSKNKKYLSNNKTLPYFLGCLGMGIWLLSPVLSDGIFIQNLLDTQVLVC